MRRSGCVVTALAALSLAGCGLGSRHASSAVSVTVTLDFGARILGSTSEAHVPQSQTVVGVLERTFRVVTRGAGRTVASINGFAGDWLVYVNGTRQQGDDSRIRVHEGDRIWWDLHDPSAIASIPSAVGSFPEPFVHGIGGRRLPTVLECVSDATSACDRVAGELRRMGVPVANQAPGTGSGTDSLTVAVGTWSDLRKTIAAHLLASGPRASGVYARFDQDGSTLDLLDARGRVARSLTGSAGLIAAPSQGSAAATWMITGTDTAGVSAAAAAFTASRLDRRFALAVQGHADLAVPQGGA